MQINNLKSNFSYIKGNGSASYPIKFKNALSKDTVSFKKKNTEINFFKELEKRKDISNDGKIFFAAIGKKEFEKAEKEFNLQRKKVLHNPKLYIGGGNTSFLIAYFSMRSFLKGENKENLTKLIYAFNDSDAFNNFLRLRDENVQEYLEKISAFNNDDLKRLSKLCRTKDQDGKPHDWRQKVEFINTIQFYKDIKSDFKEIDEKIESGIIDTEELNLNLFKSVLKICGLSEKEIEKIQEIIKSLDSIKGLFHNTSEIDINNLMTVLSNLEIDKDTLLGILTDAINHNLEIFQKQKEVKENRHQSC